MNDTGETVAKRRRFLNDLTGLKSTSVYSWHLQMGLVSDHRLAPYGCQVYSFNPKVVANFKKAYVDLPKMIGRTPG